MFSENKWGLLEFLQVHKVVALVLFVIILDTSGSFKSFFFAVLFLFTSLQIRFFVAALESFLQLGRDVLYVE